MKWLKNPVVWVVVAFAGFLGYVVAGYSGPARLRVINEARVPIRDVRVSCAGGEAEVPALEPGASAERALELGPAAELTVALEDAAGHSHRKTFPRVRGPRQEITLHVTDADAGDVTLYEASANVLRSRVDYTFDAPLSGPVAPAEAQGRDE